MKIAVLLSLVAPATAFAPLPQSYMTQTAGLVAPLPSSTALDPSWGWSSTANTNVNTNQHRYYYNNNIKNNEPSVLELALRDKFVECVDIVSAARVTFSYFDKICTAVEEKYEEIVDASQAAKGAVDYAAASIQQSHQQEYARSKTMDVVIGNFPSFTKLTESFPSNGGTMQPQFLEDKLFKKIMNRVHGKTMEKPTPLRRDSSLESRQESQRSVYTRVNNLSPARRW